MLNLLQLSGDQTWPNLLPILALKPATVTFLSSNDENQRFRRRIDAIQKTCQIMGVDFQLQLIRTASEFPTIDDCRVALKDHAVDCINLTGGTKPMSIAAAELATLNHIPAFYLDTRRTQNPIEAYDSFGIHVRDQLIAALPQIVSQITVAHALKANDFPIQTNFKAPNENWIQFSIQAAQLRLNVEADKAIKEALEVLRKQLMGDKKEMLKKQALRNALQQPIVARAGSPWHQYLLAANDAQLIQRIETNSTGLDEFLLLHDDPTTTPADNLRKTADRTFKLLEGTWFELAVLDHLRRQSEFSDIAWSVEADHAQDHTASSRGETDLVAFNAKTLNLHFVSCKTSGPHDRSLEHIQGLRNRASKEGGQYSKAELWIFRPKSEQNRQDLTDHCNEQKVELRIFSDSKPHA